MTPNASTPAGSEIVVRHGFPRAARRAFASPHSSRDVNEVPYATRRPTRCACHPDRMMWLGSKRFSVVTPGLAGCVPATRCPRRE